MLTTTRRSTVVVRLAVAAVGVGTATCGLLLPGTAYAAQPHGDAPGKSAAAHAQQDTTRTNHRSVQLHDRHRWQAQADPDGAENGGVDQPGGQGGTIGAQDGNNGSGNDLDCEDDNRGRGIPGHCKTREGHMSQRTRTQVTRPTASTTDQDSTQELVSAPTTGTTTTSEAMVADEGLQTWVLPPSRVSTLAAGLASSEAVAAPAATAAQAAPAPTAAGVMPNTGAPEGLAWFALAGALALGAGGTGVVAARRTR